MKITIGLFVIILAGFCGTAIYNSYVTSAYESSFVSTYRYSCRLTSDALLSNATFFIPVPADPAGISPVVWKVSSKEISGLPADWSVDLYDTGKATLLKITAPEVRPPAGTPEGGKFTLTFGAEASKDTPVDTATPWKDGALFRPAMELAQTDCRSAGGYPAGSRPACFRYITAVYADYDAVPDATVVIEAEYTARNEWSVFGPEYNEYRNSISVLLHGSNDGWVRTEGNLATGIGTTLVSGPPVLFS